MLKKQKEGAGQCDEQLRGSLHRTEASEDSLGLSFCKYLGEMGQVSQTQTP